MIFLEVFGNVALDLTPQVAEISKWVKGLGIIAVIWIAYSAIIFYTNRKNAQMIKGIKKDLNEVNHKLDKLIKKRNKYK